MRSSGMRSATVPWVSPRSQARVERAGRITVSAPGQKRSVERDDRVGDDLGQRFERAARGHEHGRRRIGAAALRHQQAADGHRLERIRGDAVDGVGGHDDEIAAGDRGAGFTHAREQRDRVGAIDHRRHAVMVPGAAHCGRPQHDCCHFLSP